MKKALKDIISEVDKRVTTGDLVLDIGCNDGTTLRMYNTKGLKLIGFEPATNLVEEARKGTTKIINDFFNYEAFRQNFGDEKVKVITAIAMFYDLDDPNKFLIDIKKCLDEDGVFIIEQRYLPSMLSQNDIGNICHEHLEYYSLLSLRNLLNRHGLEIFDVKLSDVNGGSFRTYIRHVEASKVSFKGGAERLRKLESYENGLGLDGLKVYKEFAERAKSIKSKVYNFVKAVHDDGKIIHIYGASTKGNTILQYFGIDNTLIEAAAERDHRKVSRKTVGTNIPIITEVDSRKRADYFLVLIWHFRDAVLKREREFLESGGKMIFPLPNFEVVTAENLSDQLEHGNE